MFFILGLFSMFNRDREGGFLLLTPLLLTYLASFLHLYPVSDRLILFMAPILTILLAEGVDKFLSWPNAKLMKIASIIVVLLLLYNPIVHGLRYEKGETWDAGIEQAMTYIDQNFATGDLTLYVRILPGEPVFLYLSPYPFPEHQMIVKFPDLPSRQDYSAELIRLAETYDRLWVYFSVVGNNDEAKDQKYILNLLSDIARNSDLHFIEETDKYIYSFDFETAK